MRILLPLPNHDFDPTETSVPWRALVDAGHEVVFATPDGRAAEADTRILSGKGFAIWRSFLRAVAHARDVHDEMIASEEFRRPLSYADLESEGPGAFDGMILTGGHAPRMKSYLESEIVQRFVVAHMRAGKPVGAICHGVLVPARSIDPETGRSVLYGRKTTCLTRFQELTAWSMTGLWLGCYYRTYPKTVQDEVTEALASPADFQAGPFSMRREGPQRPEFGFTVRDGNYLSGRYYVDAYRFAREYVAMLAERG
ncbi:MAG: DJ-1/PfpI family protein [Myxococcales bacterium]|nr:DJ-1/PfpI family protein [Myxococcales bacterium]